MTGNPWPVDEGEITSTIKSGKSQDSGWLVFRGPTADAVKRQMCDAFGLDPASQAKFSLAELTLSLTQAFQAGGAALEVLGGRIVDPESGVPAAYGAHPQDTEATTPGQRGVVDWQAKPANVMGVHNLILESPTSDHLNTVIWPQYHETIKSDADLESFFIEFRDSMAWEERKAAEAAAVN